MAHIARCQTSNFATTPLGSPYAVSPADLILPWGGFHGSNYHDFQVDTG
jgi:hypothetical protein